MESLYSILAIIGAGLLVWYTYRTVRSRPESFRGESMQHSLKTMGLLALALILFVGFLVLMLKA